MEKVTATMKTRWTLSVSAYVRSAGDLHDKFCKGSTNDETGV